MPETKEQEEFGVSWQASEYIHHEKSFLWFVFYILGSAFVIAVTYFLLKDIASVVVIALMVVAVGIFANKQPRSLNYTLNDQGISVEGKEIEYSAFKSFSIMSAGAIDSFYLEPLERFKPALTVYFAPEDESKILDVLGQYLPHRNREPDAVERLVHKFRL